jgi:hypothetical protein
MNARVIFVAAATLLLLGCDSSSSSIPPTSEAVSGVKFDVRPKRVCAVPQEVQVSWDVAAAGVKTAKVFVVFAGEERFAFSGTKGSQKMAWTTAGTVFVLKDGDETRQLAKFVVGRKCDKEERECMRRLFVKPACFGSG